jgi:hypothetical protein
MKIVGIDSSPRSSAKVNKANLHLLNAAAVADLVQNLADHNVLDDLIPSTIVSAMDCIRYHIMAAQTLQQQIYADTRAQKEMDNG